MMTCSINGEEKKFEHPPTIVALLASLNLPSLGIAVVVNGNVIAHSAHASTTIEDGDELQLVRAVAGG